MRNNFLICRRNILIEIAATLIERSWQSCKTPVATYNSTFRASQKSFATFSRIPSSTGTSRRRRVGKRFLGKHELYTRARSVALEIAFVRQGHSHTLDRSRSLDIGAGTFATFLSELLFATCPVPRAWMCTRGESRNVRSLIETGITSINPLCRAVSC